MTPIDHFRLICARLAIDDREAALKEFEIAWERANLEGQLTALRRVNLEIDDRVIALQRTSKNP